MNQQDKIELSKRVAESVVIDFITDEYIKDLVRFNETTEDDNSYDLPKIKILALRKAGLVAHTSAGVYMLTDFGVAILKCLEKME